jgi:hypothetical protein
LKKKSTSYENPFFLFLFLVIVFTGCATNPTNKGSVVSKNAPAWFKEVPADGRKYLYAVGMASGTRSEIALAKAETAAKLQMARKLSEKVEALQKVYIDETGSGGDVATSEAFTQAVKTITNAQLVGASITKTETVALKKDAVSKPSFWCGCQPDAPANKLLKAFQKSPMCLKNSPAPVLSSSLWSTTGKNKTVDVSGNSKPDFCEHFPDRRLRSVIVGRRTRAVTGVSTVFRDACGYPVQTPASPGNFCALRFHLPSEQ